MVSKASVLFSTLLNSTVTDSISLPKDYYDELQFIGEPLQLRLAPPHARHHPFVSCPYNSAHYYLRHWVVVGGTVASSPRHGVGAVASPLRCKKMPVVGLDTKGHS